MRVTLVGLKQVGALRNTSLEGFSMVSEVTHSFVGCLKIR